MIGLIFIPHPDTKATHDPNVEMTHNMVNGPTVQFVLPLLGWAHLIVYTVPRDYNDRTIVDANCSWNTHYTGA